MYVKVAGRGTSLGKGRDNDAVSQQSFETNVLFIQVTSSFLELFYIIQLF